MNPQFIVEVMETVANYDCRSELWWSHWNQTTETHDDDWHFSIMCNDAFVWACSDTVELGEDDLPMLRQALEDADAINSYHGPLLYCARKRGMRPQGAMFQYFTTVEEIALFRATGPVREAGVGNPYSVEAALFKSMQQDTRDVNAAQYKVERTRYLVNELHKLHGGPVDNW